MSSASWRLPLHIPVAVLFSLLILAVAATISFYHLRETRLLLEAANAELFRNLAEDARRTLAEANRAVRRSFILLAASPLADAATHAERFQFLPELTGLLEADPLIESVMVGYGDGAFFLLRRAEGGGWAVLDLSPDEADEVPAVAYRFDAGLRFLDAAVVPGTHFEPRLSIWYRRAAASNEVVVTAPAPLEHCGERGVTFARRNGSAVFGVNVGFGQLSVLLARRAATPSTRIRLLARDGSLLAAPEPEGAAAGTAFAGGEAMIRQALLSAPAAARFDRLVADEAARSWHVSVAPLAGFGDEDWWLAVATPDDEIFAEAHRQRRNAVLFTVAAVLASLPLAWALSRLLTTPLHRLAGEARVLSALHFEPQPETHSVILEVDELAEAMTMMRAAIARFLAMGRDLGSAREVGSVLQQVEAGAREVAVVPWSAVKVDGEAIHGVSPPWLAAAAEGGGAGAGGPRRTNSPPTSWRPTGR